MRVLHLDTEKTWRGGENQVKALILGLQDKIEKQYAAAPYDSIAILEKRWDCELLPLASGNPYDPRNIFQLLNYIKNNKIQIVDAHTAKAHTLALNVKKFFNEFKLVVHRRVDNKIKKNLLTRLKYHSMGVDQYVAISQAISNIMITYGVPKEKVTVVKSAVDTKIYEKLNRLNLRKEIMTRYQIPINFTIIGNASALSEQKGYPTLLRAASELKKISPHFKVLIAGDGDQKEILEKLVQDLQLQNDVIFLGFIKNVPEFLSCLDILAIPSNNEGLGTVILDAILAGCCPVGSRVGGIPEIIKNDETGLLIEPGDYRNLAVQLNKLIVDPEMRVRLVQNAQKHVLNEFSLESMVNGNYQVYKTLTRN